MSGKIQIGLGVAINLALELLTQAQKVNTLIQAAQLRGDGTLDQDEIDAILGERKKAFDRLDAAIERAETPKE